MGGPWGIGCLVCATAGSKSTFGRYAVDTLGMMQPSKLVQHQNFSCHQQALKKLRWESVPAVLACTVGWLCHGPSRTGSTTPARATRVAGWLRAGHWVGGRVDPVLRKGP